MVNNSESIDADELIRSKPFSYESHFLNIGEYRMHYLDEGNAEGENKPVVLLLHGNPTWCFYYRLLLEELKSSFRVIVPDYIGCGLSSHPADRHFRAKDRIEHLKILVKELGLTRYSLVMHDWGGSIGSALAADNPEAVEKLVYLNTTITETESLPRIIKVAARPFIGKFLTKYSKRFLKLTTDFGVCKKLSKEVREGYLFPYRTAARRNAIWDFVADIPFDSSHPTYSVMLDLAGRIKNLSHVPVQIVWGLKDPCFHREMLTKVAQHFPQARILEIPEASHLVLEDAPALANKTIREFLQADTATLKEEAAELASRREKLVPHGVNSLYSAFCRSAGEFPRKEAAIVPSFLGDTVRYAHITYQDLLLLVNKYQRGLYELGLRAGDKVIMLVAPGIEFLALSYAVMGRGAIPVFIDPGMGKDNLCTSIEEISPQALLGSPKAHLLRFAKKKIFAGLKFHIVASDWVPCWGPNLSFLKKFSSKELPSVSSPGIALIAFTSGATGKPKGVVYTDEMVTEQLRIFREEFGMEAGARDLPLLPIFSLFNVANGICSVFPPINPSKPLSVEPGRILKIINDLGVQYSFGSPTLWNKIAEYCIRSRSNLNPLKKIFMAGAPVPGATLLKVRELLEDGEAYTPYGATEALPVTLVSSGQVLTNTPVPAGGGELGTFVGRPVQGIELKVIRRVDGPIPQIQDVQVLSPLEIGEVIVKGRNVSPQYWDRPDAGLLGKIKDGEGFWHRMGDMGYLDGAGNLYFCGRKAHIVSGNGKTFYSIPVENIFNSHAQVRRSALVSLNGGSEPAIVIEPQPEYWPESLPAREAFRGEMLNLAKSSPLTASIEKVFFHRSFPVDARHNAKIFRDKLGMWASETAEKDRAI